MSMNEQQTQAKENIRKLLVRLELWFAPILIIIPLVVSMFFLSIWYIKGFSSGSSAFTGELMIGLLILVGNLLIDIPFLRSIRVLRKKD